MNLSESSLSRSKGSVSGSTMAVEERIRENKAKGKNILVGIRFDESDKELLNLTLAKIAEPGDRIIAVHVCKDSEKLSSLILLGVLDDYLAEYEVLCNVKQVELVGRISRGNSIRKILVREAKSYQVTIVIVGISNNNVIGGSLTLARYCSKKLPTTITIMAIHKRKVVFLRNSEHLQDPRPSFGSSLYPRVGFSSRDLIAITREEPEFTYSNPLKANKIGKSLKEVIEIDSKYRSMKHNCHNEISGDDSSKNSPRVVNSSRDITGLKPGWPLLCKTFSGNMETISNIEEKKMSVVEWAMSLPDRALSSIPHFNLGLESLDRSFRKTHSCSSLATLVKTSDAAHFKWFDYKEMMKMTESFSSENLIGKGGSSLVYKGFLPDKRPAAIKVSKLTNEMTKDFLLEINVVSSLQHKHIVPLIGVCVQDKQVFSVYRYFSKGSLEKNLHDVKQVLPWSVRFNIAVGVAEAINYLHNECSPRVIHRDVKSSNILLSDKYEAQLSDFGLAICTPHASSYETQSDEIVGTFGYFAPEYFMYGKCSDKIDVYSFGVVLLELLSGRQPISTANPNVQESLVMWATSILKSGKIEDLVDKKLCGEFDDYQMRKMVLAASLSITRTARLRPRINQILKILKGDEDVTESIPFEVSHEKRDEKDRASSIGGSLFNTDESSTSFDSIDQTGNSLEEYLQGRWSRSSSFD